jgi:predicted NACHT family NTPase
MNDVQTPSAADLLRDTLHTVHTYITPIRSHALHVYHSAFVTMPACPLLNQMLQQFGQAELPQLISQRATSGWPWATVLEGHEGWALSVAVSKDGRRIASGARDNTVRVWDAVMLEEIAVLKGHEHWVTSVVFCPDGKRLLSASDDGTIRMWDVNSYSAEPIAVLLCEDTGRMLSVAVSPDGEHIASGSADSAVRVWNADTYDSSPRILRGHQDKVNMVVYSPNSRSIVSCSDDGTVRIWDAVSDEQLGVMEHDYSVLCVAFSWDGTRLVSGSWDCTARVWDAETYDELARLEGHEHAARAAAFSPDGQSIVTGSGNGTVRVWNSQSFGASGKVIGSSLTRSLSDLHSDQYMSSHLRRTCDPWRA